MMILLCRVWSRQLSFRANFGKPGMADSVHDTIACHHLEIFFEGTTIWIYVAQCKITYVHIAYRFHCN